MTVAVRPDLPELARRARALAVAASPSDAFRAVLDASALAAPRGAILLVRQDRLRGWGCVGYPPAVAQRLRTVSIVLDRAWLTAVADGSDADPELDVDFGQAPAALRSLVPLRVKGQVIALVLLEGDGDSHWQPAVTSTLLTVAELRLELDIAERRTRPAGERPRAEPVPVTAPAAAPAHAPSQAASEVSLGALDLEPAPKPRPAGDDSPQLAAARRYARLVATDIKLYNEEAVLTGRRHGDLKQRLGDQLGRGKEAFLKRYASLGPAGLVMLHEAYVEVLAGGETNLLPAPAAE